MRIGAAAARCAGPALRVNKTPRAIWAVSEKDLKSEPEAVLTVSVHAARRKPMGLLVLYGARMCSFQGARKWDRAAIGERIGDRGALYLARSRFFGGFDRFFSGLFRQTQRPQLRRLFANNPAVGLIFHHGLGAILGTLFLPKTRFCPGSSLARPGLSRFCRQSHSPSASKSALYHW